MNKCLIILTRKYPYSYGEPSLETEFPYHQKLFNRIIVLAEDVSKDEKITRVPPESVEYYNTATSSRRAGRIKDKLKCARFAFKPNDAVKTDKSVIGLKPVHNVFLWSFEERCQRLIKEARAVLDNLDLSGLDEIVLYSYWFFANARVAVTLADDLRKKYNVPVRVVSRAHRHDIYEYANALKYLPLRKYLLSNVEKVYTCSKDGADYMRKKYPEYSDKIDVSFLGTKDSGLGCSQPGDVFHIVSCCRIVPVKRIERLADSLALIDKPFVWTVIGGGIEGDGYYNSVKKHIMSKLGNKSNAKVEFTGALPHDDIFEYYKNNYVDVFVNVSESEGIPQVIMEACSFGVPVVATAVGGTAEILSDGENGYLLDKDFKDEDCADAILKIMNSEKEQIESFRANAREKWQKNFNYAVNNEWFAQEIYKKADK